MAQVPSKQVGANANNVINNVTCDASVAVGNWVRMSGGVAVNALADSLTNSNVIGVCEAKASSVLCSIRFLGVSLPIFTGLDETKNYFLSETTAGADKITAPIGSGNIRLKLGQPFSATQMLVLVGERVRRV